MKFEFITDKIKGNPLACLLFGIACLFTSFTLLFFCIYKMFFQIQSDYGLLFYDEITVRILSAGISTTIGLFVIYTRVRKFSKAHSFHTIRFLEVSRFLHSPKTHNEVFEPLITDWQEEYFEALFKKEIWKARWVNVRYTYAFLAAMWQKSPIGYLIEFISKLAK